MTNKIKILLLGLFVLLASAISAQNQGVCGSIVGRQVVIDYYTYRSQTLDVEDCIGTFDIYIRAHIVVIHDFTNDIHFAYREGTVLEKRTNFFKYECLDLDDNASRREELTIDDTDRTYSVITLTYRNNNGGGNAVAYAVRKDQIRHY